MKIKKTEEHLYVKGQKVFDYAASFAIPVAETTSGAYHVVTREKLVYVTVHAEKLTMYLTGASVCPDC